VTSDFSLFGPTKEPQFIGWNGVPGGTKVQSAYHSKLAGIAGIITAVEMLCSQLLIKEGAINIGLDELEALNNLTANGHCLQLRQILTCYLTFTDDLPGQASLGIGIG
jgi:hypothetical protein